MTNPSYLPSELMSYRSEVSIVPTREEEEVEPVMQANPSYQSSSVITSYRSQEGTVPAREEEVYMQDNPSYLPMSYRSEVSIVPAREEEEVEPVMQANPSYQSSSVITSYRSQEGNVPTREEEVYMQDNPSYCPAR